MGEEPTLVCFLFTCLGSTCSFKEMKNEGNDEEKKRKKKEARLKLSNNPRLGKTLTLFINVFLVGLSWV